jgi:hypothetical protein
MSKSTNAALRKAARLLSKKGNAARQRKLSPERRTEIARKAAQTRWSAAA